METRAGGECDPSRGPYERLEASAPSGRVGGRALACGQEEEGGDVVMACVAGGYSS